MAKDNELYLEIVSPQGIIFQGDVEKVSIPTYSGQITVFPHHAPLFTKLGEGEVDLITGGKTTTVVIAGGFLEIKGGSAHILSDHAIRAESIELAKVEERKRQAEDRLKEKLSNEDFTVADKDLKLSILELKVAQKMRRRQRP